MGIVTDIVLPLVLAFMMFTLGLGLKARDFGRILTRPKDILAGLAMQVILLPAVGLALVSFWPLAPELAMGVMLIAAAPGGVTSNYLTSLALGDVALSVSLTAITSLISVITIPIVLAFSYQYVMGNPMTAEIPIGKTALSIFLIVTVPVILGMTCRHFAEKLVLKVEPKAHIISTLFFALVLAGAVIQEHDNAISYFADAGAVTLALNLLMMNLAFMIAKTLNSGTAQRISISIECGLQNGTLAIAVGVILFQGGAYIIPAATYSLIMFATSLAFLVFARRRLVPGSQPA